MIVRSLTLFCFLSLAFGVSAADLPLPLDHDTIVRYFNDGDFAALEQMADEARTTKALNVQGFWQLTKFYSSMEEILAPHTRDSVEALNASLDRWKRAYPNSVTWRIALAEQLINKGWDARGNGLAYTVTEDGWRVFRLHLTDAWKVLLETKNISTEDPHIFSLMMAIGMGLGDDPLRSTSTSTFSLIARSIREAFGAAARQKEATPIHDLLFDEAITYELHYWPLYEQYAYAVLPRWGGEPGQVEAFAARSADATEKELGDSLYARIAIDVLGYMEEEYYQTDHNFEWTRIRSGLDRLLADFPDSRILPNYACRMACAHGDREAAAMYRVAIKYPLPDRTWRNRNRMNTWFKWIDGEIPYPSGGLIVIAIFEDDTDELLRLLRAGFSANDFSMDGHRPLNFAAGKGKLDAAQILIDAGADTNGFSAQGNTPLREASHKQNIDMMNLLLDNGADPNLATSDDWLPLGHCVRDNRMTSVRVLLERGADINGRMREGWTPLSVAVQTDNIEMVKYLLEKGADPHVRFDAGGSILKLARRRENPEMIALVEAAMSGE